MVYLCGMGHEHPEESLPNSFFEELDIGSSSEWVEERTGILARNTVLTKDDIRSLRLGKTDLVELRRAGKVPPITNYVAKPWEQARVRAGLEGDVQPNVVVAGTSVPDNCIPAHGAGIAGHLGWTQPFCVDINSACSSFVVDLVCAANLMGSHNFDLGAIFNMERYSITLDYSDRKSAVLFGDGSSCAVLSREARPGSFRLRGSLLKSNPSGCDSVVIPIDGFFSQKGSRVQKFAISKTVEISRQLLEEHNLKLEDVSYFIGHQANLRMLKSACARLGLPEEKHLYNVDRYGNQGAAGAPIVLSTYWDKFKTGDLLLIAVVGSGLTWAAVLLEKV